MDKLLIVLGSIFVFFVLVIVMAFPTMWIVNSLFTPAFIASAVGTSSLSLTQAILLNAICSMLFKNVTSGDK